MPPDSPAAYSTVSQVRTAVHAVPGADTKVGGATAINADVEHYSIRDRDVIIPLVLVVVLIDTLIVRSVLVIALTLDVGRHMWWPSRLAARRVEDTAVRAGGELTRTS